MHDELTDMDFLALRLLEHHSDMTYEEWFDLTNSTGAMPADEHGLVHLAVEYVGFKHGWIQRCHTHHSVFSPTDPDWPCWECQEGRPPAD